MALHNETSANDFKAGCQGKKHRWWSYVGGNVEDEEGRDLAEDGCSHERRKEERKRKEKEKKEF